jgi:hypothetical protein
MSTRSTLKKELFLDPVKSIFHPLAEKVSSGFRLMVAASRRTKQTDGGAGDGIRTRDNQLGRLVFCH